MKKIIALLLAFVTMTGLAQTPSSAIVRGRIVNVPEGYEQCLSVRYDDILQITTSNKIPLQLDSLGRFEVEVPLMDRTPVILGWIWLVLAPGQTYDVEIDGMDKVAVKGRDAQLSNEINRHEPAACNLNMEEMERETDAFVLEAAEKELRRMEAANDSIARANPELSGQWREYAHYCALSNVASRVAERRYIDSAISQSTDGRLWKWLHDNFICQMPRPMSIVPDKLGYIVLNYIMKIFAPRRGKLNIRGIDTAITIALEQQADGTISRTEAFADSLKTLRVMLNDYKALADANAPDSVLSAHPFVKSVQKTFSDVYFNGLFTKGIIEERLTIDKTKRIAALDMPDDVRDYACALLIYNHLERYHAPLSPAMLSLARDVKNGYFRSQIIEKNEHYRQLAVKNESEKCLMKNEPLAGLTDGKELFSKIIEPYRGRILFVDFWGTWCGPCKHDLKNYAHPLHKALAGLPVTYLYMCNGSTDEAWRSTIAEFNITGDNIVHYNLPAAQQKAVEDYLDVKSFPTYIVFDKNGRRVTTNESEPKIYDLESVRKVMETLK